MRKEDFAIEKYFSQIKIDELPSHKKAKFKIGDLVKIVFHSDNVFSSYELRDDMALVCEVLYYQCKDYTIITVADYGNREPYYLIEYKLLPSDSKEQFRYVSEEHLRNVKND